jgi:predicted glycosyltransferase
MDILITIQHPAHVHFFKHAIDEFEARGHDVHVRALDKDVALSLLDEYDIDYKVVGSRGGSLAHVALSTLTIEYRLYREAKAIEPDVITAIGGFEAAHVAQLVGAKCVVFTDTEHATLSNTLTFPFADEVATPDCYHDDAGSNHYRYPSYHELAYLHPDRFDPDPSALDGLPVDADDTYAVLRLVSWGAAHDVGDEGLDSLAALVERLEAAGAEVLVSAEDDALPPELEGYGLELEPHLIHHVLAYADLFVGESGTMASESAVLGTPSVYVHSANPGLMRDLASFDLLFGFHGERRNERAANQAVDILQSPDIDWDERRQALLDERVDATDVIVQRVLAAVEP